MSNDATVGNGSAMDSSDALLVLADGEVFEGEAVGAAPPGGVATGEAVFNTVLSGYQEVLTDPSYAGQVIAFTYPHIGNYGVNPTDEEAIVPHCNGIIVRDLAHHPSSWRSVEGLEHFLVRHGIPGVTGIDTRRLTRHLRRFGAMPCAFGTADERTLLIAAQAAAPTNGQDLVSEVTTPTAYTRGNGPYRVVAYDFGIKETMLRHLAGFATVTVVPGVDPCGRGARTGAGRRVPLQRSRRPGGAAGHHRRDRPPRRQRSHLRDLPRASAVGHCAWRDDLEAAVRPSRGEPPGAAPVHRAGGDHVAEPQLCGDTPTRCRRPT